MTWGEALARYLDALAVRGLAASTRRERGRFLQAFVAFCRELELSSPRELTPAHLVAYRRHLAWTPAQGRLRSLSTVASRLSAVRVFLRYLVAEGHLLVDPTRDLVIPKVPRPLPRLLSEDEVLRLLEAPDPRTALGLRDRALLELLYGLGLRRSECCQLDLADYDRSLELIRVKKPKNRRERYLPVAPGLAQALEAYLSRGRPALLRFAEQPALFVSRRGARLSLVRVEQMVSGTARGVGLAGVSPHSLRHAFATHLLAGGADLRHIQTMLGHEDLASTERYTHLHPFELLEEHQRTHPRARKGSPPGAEKSS